MLRPIESLKYIFALPMLAMVVGCAQGVNFDPLAKQAASATSAGKPTPQGTCNSGTLYGTRLTKIMFLVDTSGSNTAPSDAVTDTACTMGSGDPNCFPATDPNKTFRLGSIQNFFNQYKTKSNFQWGFVTFAGSSSTAYIAANGNAIFDPNPADMQSALNQFAVEQDGGGTPYKSAIQAATQAIQNDPDRNSPSNPQYFVVLITDGYPTDYKTATDSSGDIASLIGAAPTVSLSTIFYGPQNVNSSTQAMNLLQTMAQMGKGQFANANNPANGININDVVTNAGCGP